MCVYVHTYIHVCIYIYIHVYAHPHACTYHLLLARKIPWPVFQMGKLSPGPDTGVRLVFRS